MTLRALMSLVAAACTIGAMTARSAEDNQAFEQIERGRYLAVAGDCISCHTAPGGKPFAGGAALETPFGTLLGPNITPDVATGIGSWSLKPLRNVNAMLGARSPKTRSCSWFHCGPRCSINSPSGVRAFPTPAPAFRMPESGNSTH